MTEKKQVYKCNICGNIVSILHTGAGQLVCCNAPMELVIVKEADEGAEKHLPVTEKKGGKVMTRVGEVLHPMEEAHFIEWIETSSGEESCFRFLKPGEKPESEACVKGEDVSVRAFCNIHGLWENDKIVDKEDGRIGFEDFAKVDLKIAEIVEAFALEGSEKLVKLKVKLGDEDRQIIAGIRQYYAPEDLVGKKIAIVANLEPRMMFGEQSNGMVLAAKDGESLSLLVLEKDIPSGIRLS